MTSRSCWRNILKVPAVLAAWLWLPAAISLGADPATPPGKVQIALTFDDLPYHGRPHPFWSRAEIVRKILAVLNQHNVPEAYGFVNGIQRDYYSDWEEILRDWIGAGDPLANHTYSHLDLNRVGVRWLRAGTSCRPCAPPAWP